MRKKCMKVASNDNNHQIEERKSRSPPQVLNLFLFVGYLIRKKTTLTFLMIRPTLEVLLVAIVILF